jgi:prepilin-type N-terminal cleavage/methylation domain-containing protein
VEYGFPVSVGSGDLDMRKRFLKHQAKEFQGKQKRPMQNIPWEEKNPHGPLRIRRWTGEWGMTFIEVIVVMVIIGILSAVVIPRLDFASFSQASVDGAAQLVASDIRYAQEFAMANRVSKSIIFASGSGVYTFNPIHTLDPSGQIPSGITITNNFTVTFNSFGEPTTGGGGSVTISGGGQTKTISLVNYTGKVNIS